ncbi:DNA-binding protein, partial [Providencia heimbachae]
KRGVQGKAVEYYVESLPGEIQGQLTLSEPLVTYQSQRTDALQIWSEAYYQLTEDERRKIVKYILRRGLSSLLAQIDEEEKGEK